MTFALTAFCLNSSLDLSLRYCSTECSNTLSARSPFTYKTPSRSVLSVLCQSLRPPTPFILLATIPSMFYRGNGSIHPAVAHPSALLPIYFRRTITNFAHLVLEGPIHLAVVSFCRVIKLMTPITATGPFSMQQDTTAPATSVLTEPGELSLLQVKLVAPSFCPHIIFCLLIE